MKVLSQKFLILLLTICMVTPLLSQPALALDSLGEDDPGSIVVVPGFDMGSDTMEIMDVDPGLIDADVPTPHAWTEGNRVMSIRAYPLAVSPDMSETVYFTNVYVGVNYSVSYPSLAGFYLSKNQTTNVMQRMLSALKATSPYENYLLVGWHIEADISFYYSKPEYVIYKFKTSTMVGEETRTDINNTNFVGTFKNDFAYPATDNIDPLNDYYYMGVEGAFYSKNSSGNSVGRAFSASVGFNSPYPTNPD